MSYLCDFTGKAIDKRNLYNGYQLTTPLHGTGEPISWCRRAYRTIRTPRRKGFGRKTLLVHQEQRGSAQPRRAHHRVGANKTCPPSRQRRTRLDNQARP